MHSLAGICFFTHSRSTKEEAVYPGKDNELTSCKNAAGVGRFPELLKKSPDSAKTVS
jgi:hypothetical protein